MMITKIKTALLGYGHLTSGEGMFPNRGGAYAGERNRSNVSETVTSHPTSGQNHDRIGLDQIFGVLRNQRRRYVLKYLSMTDGAVTLGDLAERIAAWEGDKDIGQVTSKERKCVYTGLYQCHLPKMADVSAISYDRRSGDVEAGEQFDSFCHYLRNDEHPSGRGFGLSLLS